jgi:hypothetical protein
MNSLRLRSEAALHCSLWLGGQWPDGVIIQKDVAMSLKRFLAATAGSLASLALLGQSLVAQDPSIYCETEPGTIFSGGVQYLAMTRDSNLSRPKM